MEIRRKLSRLINMIVILLLLLTVTLFIMMIAIFLLGWRLNDSNVNLDKEEYNTYRYYKTNPTTNISSSGLLTIYEQLPHEGFIFQKTGDSLMIISKFGSTEYQCRGRCSCEKKSHRQGSFNQSQGNIGHFEFSSSSVTSQGMTYLVTAKSSNKAFELSDEYFKTECEKICPENSVMQAKANECFTVKEIEKRKEKEKKEYEKIMEEHKKRAKKKMEEFEELNDLLPRATGHFTCYGKCFSRFGKMTRSIFSNIKSLFGSEETSEEEEICQKIDLSSTMILGERRSFTEEEIAEAAKKGFIEKLHHYCRRNSFFEHQEEFLCVGRNKEGVNPSVECAEIGSSLWW